MQLKHARTRKRLTLAQLAKLTGVNKSTISRLERGHTQPYHETAEALRKALGVRIDFRHSSEAA
jgi:transcriptional regulator with XRE-family HTH domain